MCILSTIIISIQSTCQCEKCTCVIYHTKTSWHGNTFHTTSSLLGIHRSVAASYHKGLWGALMFSESPVVWDAMTPTRLDCNAFEQCHSNTHELPLVVFGNVSWYRFRCLKTVNFVKIVFSCHHVLGVMHSWIEYRLDIYQRHPRPTPLSALNRIKTPTKRESTWYMKGLFTSTFFSCSAVSMNVMPPSFIRFLRPAILVLCRCRNHDQT